MGVSRPGPDVLGIIISNRCNAVCRHCCNESGPDKHGVVSFAEIAKLIDEASDLPSIKEVGVSGGEPFLFVDLLRRIARHAATKGLSTSVTTNGFWGRSGGARALLRGLKGDGLAAVHISTSTFHREFFTQETVVSAAAAALEAELAVTVNVVVSGTGGSLESMRLPFGAIADRITFAVLPALPAGRAEYELAPDEFAPLHARPLGNCSEHFKKIAVDPGGDVYPCCSPGGFTPPLRLGNVAAGTLGSILDRSARNPVLAVLESVGPSYFLPFLRERGHALPNAFTDQCHLCRVMLSSAASARAVADVAEELVAAIAALPGSNRPREAARMARILGEMAEEPFH